MLPTPDLGHLTAKDYQKVYEPAEDTFILLDALEKDADSLRGKRPIVCLEIGSGSGCVSAFIGQIIGSSCLYLCTDINPEAVRCTSLTGRQNSVALDPVITSLTDAFDQRLHRSIDILVFNPPYVPTNDEELESAQGQGDIKGSWAGGNDGMHVTNKVLSCVKNLLSENGQFYLVAIKQNNVPGIQQKMRDEEGLESEIVLQRRAGREHLFILKFRRPSIADK